jgi:hypothetical protein
VENEDRERNSVRHESIATVVLEDAAARDELVEGLAERGHPHAARSAELATRDGLVESVEGPLDAVGCAGLFGAGLGDDVLDDAQRERAPVRVQLEREGLASNERHILDLLGPSASLCRFLP